MRESNWRYGARKGQEQKTSRKTPKRAKMALQRIKMAVRKIEVKTS